MAIPFLSLLPTTARAAFPFIMAGTRRGLSSRAIERIVRSAGFKISRPRSIIPLMRELRAIQKFGSAVKFTPKGSMINVSKLPESLTPIRRNYSFLVRVIGHDPFGNLVNRHVTVTTDNQFVTPEMLEDTATEMVTDEGISDNLVDVRVTLQEGMRRADLPD